VKRTGSTPPQAWLDALHAAALFAIDPVAIGGIVVQARSGPVRDRWLSLVTSFLEPHHTVRRIPAQISQGRLLGGLDLNATLQSGQPVTERGILATLDGDVLLIGSAERLPAVTAACIAAALDSGEVVTERDGISARSPARFGLIAFDESAEADEALPSSLRDRLPCRIFLDTVAFQQIHDPAQDTASIQLARDLLPDVQMDDNALQALCAAAQDFGIATLRAPLVAAHLARAAAALDGRLTVETEDVVLAGRLALAPATVSLPPSEPESEPAPEQANDSDSPPDEGETEQPAQDDEDASTAPSEEPLSGSLEETVQAAVRAAIPADILARLTQGMPTRSGGGSTGRAATFRKSRNWGTPLGTKKGDPRSDGRLNVIETLRAAAPWQRIRERENRAANREGPKPSRLIVLPDDFRVNRYKHRTNTTTIFAVDASGSAALNRLAEAKGAVEILLAESYIRRDNVALISFRGTLADILLPPTRSLAKAKRRLATLPGGGGTPLANGIAAALTMALAVRQRGDIPAIIVLTDGRANIGLDGTPGRPAGESDALKIAGAVRAQNLNTLLIDIAANARPFARELASAMGALYYALPNGTASDISTSIKRLAN